jgi:hypothetical protein
MDEMTKMKIEQRAYELFVKRGGIHGYHFEDWQQAESEINTFSSSAGKVPIETPEHSKADHTNKSSAKTVSRIKPLTVKTTVKNNQRIKPEKK